MLGMTNCIDNIRTAKQRKTNKQMNKTKEKRNIIRCETHPRLGFVVVYYESYRSH